MHGATHIKVLGRMFIGNVAMFDPVVQSWNEFVSLYVL